MNGRSEATFLQSTFENVLISAFVPSIQRQPVPLQTEATGHNIRKKKGMQEPQDPSGKRKSSRPDCDASTVAFSFTRVTRTNH